MRPLRWKTSRSLVALRDTNLGALWAHAGDWGKNEGDDGEAADGCQGLFETKRM